MSRLREFRRPGTVGTMKKRVSPRTSYLFAQPSALDGVARTFDFWGVYDSYNIVEPTGAADVLAFIQDVLVVEEAADSMLRPSQIQVANERD